MRTVQRVVQDERQSHLAADVATIRFETPPGKQMQIDFGQKRVVIGGTSVTVHLLVTVLSYSRRIFVRPFLAERGDDWRQGIAAAFRHFGGVVRILLGDSAKALVVGRYWATCTVTFHPAYLAFCRDWDVEPRACAPYRARTKGKTESGVEYVKSNALAGRAFDSFHALEEHLASWMFEADRRVHGTTFERPIDRFTRLEADALRRCPRGRCRCASSTCVAASRTMRSSISTRFGTACRIASCVTSPRSPSRKPVGSHRATRAEGRMAIVPGHAGSVRRRPVPAGRPPRGRQICSPRILLTDRRQPAPSASRSPASEPEQLLH